MYFSSKGCWEALHFICDDSFSTDLDDEPAQQTPASSSTAAAVEHSIVVDAEEQLVQHQEQEVVVDDQESHPATDDGINDASSMAEQEVDSNVAHDFDETNAESSAGTDTRGPGHSSTCGAGED